jgi:SulP family sulfate permease
MHPLPITQWLGRYTRESFGSDVVAGVITATLLIPQAMAYSQLAGLPPQIGLYASMLPPVLYALFGSSTTLAVGPVAVASIMVAAALGSIWTPGSPEYVAGAFILSFLVGGLLLLMGLVRLGVVANFLSHPVLSGFTNAAALVILVSQLEPLLGTGDLTWQRLGELAAGIHLPTAAVGVGAVLVLVLVARYGARWLAALGVAPRLRGLLTRLTPLLLVAGGTAAVWAFDLHARAGVAVVGEIPAGLPALTLPAFDLEIWTRLFGAAVAIALVSFVESLSIAKVLAARRREKIDANQELVGLGVANLGAALTSGSPVCGGFSRSVVNFEAGARTQVAAIVTASLIALAALFFTPLLFHLPVAILAAIVVVSVTSLFDLRTLTLCWRYNPADAVALLATFVAVLVAGIEVGIALGVVLSLLLFLWRTSQPHMAVVGRVGRTEHFRNVERHRVTTYPGILAVRVDESLYFANTQALEQRLLNAVAERPEVEHLLLICNAVNLIDTSALETLEDLIEELRNAGVTLHLAEVKGPVRDRLERTDLLDKLAPGRVFLSTHEAIEALSGRTPPSGTEQPPRRRESQ